MGWLRPSTGVPRWRALPLASALLAAALAAGCVDRLLRIKSEPPGARVFVDGIEVGRSPVIVPFEHYGTREVLVRPDPARADDTTALEYTSAVQQVELPTPWYQWPGIDFVAEYLWPGTIVDEHEARFQLAPFDRAALERRLDEESQRLDARVEPPGDAE